MKEIRIDLSKQTSQQLALANEQAQKVFRYNHAMPGTPEYAELMHAVFNKMGENSNVLAPVTAVRPHNVRIGKNVIVMPNSLWMSAGGITIEDDVQVSANAQFLSNNHDFHEPQIITCKPVRVCKGAWIGAGATILPGVTVGEHAVVGAGSVVTHDVEPYTVVAGNPAKFIKRFEPQHDCASLNEEDMPQQLGLDSCGD